MSLTGKRCECGNAASYGLPTDRKRLWCGPCGKQHGAVLLQQQKMCEDCGLKCAGFGLLAEKKRRWSASIPARLLSPLADAQIACRFPDFQRRNPAAETRRGIKAERCLRGRVQVRAVWQTPRRCSPDLDQDV